MRLATVKRRISEIKRIYRGDPEGAHGLEDRLVWDYVESVAPDDEVATALLELSKADRTRWYA